MSQSLSLPSQISALGTWAVQAGAPPEHCVTPVQVPSSLETLQGISTIPSSVDPSQSSSAPLQLSSTGVAAVQALSVASRQPRVPVQVPTSLTAEHVVLAASFTAFQVHSQSPSSFRHWPASHA